MAERWAMTCSITKTDPGLDGMSELHKRTGLPLATNMVVTDFR